MNPNPSPILITGAALASSLGTDRETTWQAILAGKNGFGPMTAMESPLPGEKDGAQAIDLPADYFPELPREARYLRWTIAAAIEDAQLLAYLDVGALDGKPMLRSLKVGRLKAYAPSRCAILLGTTLHGMRAGGQFLRSKDFSQLKNFPAGATLKLAAEGLPFAGAGLTTCSACSSSLGAIALAVTMLQSGQADCVIAGGYDTISEYVYGGFNSLRLVADGPLRPFSKNRQGMKLAEGYGIVVLERAEEFARRIAGVSFPGTSGLAGDGTRAAHGRGPDSGPISVGEKTTQASASGTLSSLSASPFTPTLSATGRGSRSGVAKTALAHILGWGESADAHHLTQPHPTGDGAARAMLAALGRAGLAPAGIDLIAAHATGTPDNDAGEFAAMSRVFGDDLPRVPVVGFKSHLGHTLGGAGAVELILSALALRDQIAPACANISADDLEFPGLNVTTGAAKPATIRATLNTSLGFGGANTCVVLALPSAKGLPPLPPGEGSNSPGRSNLVAAGTILPLPSGERAGARGETSQVEQPLATLESSEEHTSATERNSSPPRFAAHLTSPLRGEGPIKFPREVFITGLGVIAPGILGREGLLARLQQPQPASVLTAVIGDAALEGLLNARRIRRMSEYVKLQLAAATLACRDAGLLDLGELAADFSAILGSAHGSANYSYTYYEQIVREGVIGANPMLFAEGVPNAGAAHISLMLGLKGACQSVIGTRTAGLDALALAAMRIAAGEWDRAIVGAGEEDSDVVRRAYQHCSLASSGEGAGAFAGETGFLCAGGAAAMVLESRPAMEARGGRAIGSIDAVAFARSERARLETAVVNVLQQLGSPASVLSSASGTWLDAIEARAMSTADVKETTSIYGHVAETFSASPLIGIAATLAGRGLPVLPGGLANLGNVQAADGKQPIDRFGVICTDPTGLVTGARIIIL